MVELLSIFALSGLSGLGGMVLSKLGRKRKTEETSMNAGVEFIVLKEVIDPKQLLPFLSYQKSIFINTKNLNLPKLQKLEFLNDLKSFCGENELKLNSVSSTLLFITPAENKINIRTLVNHANIPRKLDLDDIEVNGS